MSILSAFCSSSSRTRRRCVMDPCTGSSPSMYCSHLRLCRWSYGVSSLRLRRWPDPFVENVSLVPLLPRLPCDCCFVASTEESFLSPTALVEDIPVFSGAGLDVCVSMSVEASAGAWTWRESEAPGCADDWAGSIVLASVKDSSALPAASALASPSCSSCCSAWWRWMISVSSRCRKMAICSSVRVRLVPSE